MTLYLVLLFLLLRSIGPIMGRRGLVEGGPALLQGNVDVLGVSEHRVHRLRLDLLLVLLNLLNWVGP